MNKDLHDIDNLFKQAIDGHLEEVPVEVWQNIDHGLDKKQVAFYKRRYFTVRAAAILLLLIGSVTIAAILRYHSAEEQVGKEVVTTKTSNQLNKIRERSGEPGKQNIEKEQESVAQEQLPEDKRRKTIDDTLKRLRDQQARMRAASSEDGSVDTNGPPVISEELQAKIRTIGLKTFYSESSAQTKAELAPVLEELQRSMESGRPFHGH